MRDLRKIPLWEWAVTALLVGAVAFAVFGCGTPTEYAIHINPATGEGTAVATKAALITPIGGRKVAEAEVTELPAGMGLFEIVGLVLGGSTLVTSLFPKGQAILSMLFQPGVSVKEKLQGAVALPLPFINSPPAAHAIIEKRRAVKFHKSRKET